MTDERRSEALLPAVRALPRGSGIVFRHHRTAPIVRRALFAKVRAVARRRRLVLVLAGTARLATAWRADGVHRRSAARSTRPMLRTAPAHDRRELIAAQRGGADLVFLSPVFATRSHPGAPALGAVRFGRIAGGCGLVVALGGMDAARYRRVRALCHGWAAIDALSGDRSARLV